MTEYISVVCKPLVYGNSLWKPQETNTPFTDGTGCFEGGERPITGGVEAVSGRTLVGDAMVVSGFADAETPDSRVVLRAGHALSSPETLRFQSRGARRRAFRYKPRGREHSSVYTLTQESIDAVNAALLT